MLISADLLQRWVLLGFEFPHESTLDHFSVRMFFSHVHYFDDLGASEEVH